MRANKYFTDSSLHSTAKEQTIVVTIEKFRTSHIRYLHIPSIVFLYATNIRQWVLCFCLPSALVNGLELPTIYFIVLIHREM